MSMTQTETYQNASKGHPVTYQYVGPSAQVMNDSTETDMEVFGKTHFVVTKSVDPALHECQRIVALAMRDPQFSGQAMASKTNCSGFKSLEASKTIWNVIQNNFSSQGMQIPSSADEVTILGLASSGFRWWFSRKDSKNKEWLHTLEFEGEQPNQEHLIKQCGLPCCCVGAVTSISSGPGFTMNLLKTAHYTGLPKPAGLDLIGRKIDWESGFIEAEIFLTGISVQECKAYVKALFENIMRMTNAGKDMDGVISNTNDGLMAALDNTGDVFFQRLLSDKNGKNWEIKLYLDATEFYFKKSCCGYSHSQTAGNGYKASNTKFMPWNCFGIQCFGGKPILCCPCELLGAFPLYAQDHTRKIPALHLRVLTLSNND